MESALDWFINHILPWVFIGSVTVFIYNYNEIKRLGSLITNHVDRADSASAANKERITSLDLQLRRDVADLRADVEYLSRNTVSRPEMERYLNQLNGVVERISNNLDKLL